MATSDEQHAAQVKTLLREIAALEAQMERPCQDFIKATGEAFVSWCESEMSAVVGEQHGRSGQLGADGMVRLKEWFIRFLADTKAALQARLALPAYWTHKASEPGKAGAKCAKDAYGPRNTVKDYPFGRAVVELYGKLGEFIRDNGYELPKGAYGPVDKKEKPDGLQYVRPIEPTDQMKHALAEYSSLHQQLIGRLERLAELDNARAKENAGWLWDNAFSLALGEVLDWDSLWERASELADDYLQEVGKWDQQFLNWLLDVRPAEGQDEFEDFLRSTGNTAKFEEQSYRLHRVALIRSVQKHLRKTELDRATAGAIEEQVKARHYAGLAVDHIIEEYRYQTCHDCRRTCEGDDITLCDKCNRCDECCKC
jgi:hypothetical protein